MDNEISNEFIQALRQQQTSYQLVPPHTHHRNITERAIQTYKNHFKGGLTSANPNFLLSEWDRFIEQANITLNLLRSSRENPKISAYTYIFGKFNFNATPLAPPGKKLSPTSNRINDVPGNWMEKKVCTWVHQFTITGVLSVTPQTQKIARYCNTVTFFPKLVPFLRVMLDNFLRQAAQDIITILTDTPSTTTPTLEAVYPVQNALLTLAAQIKCVDNIPQQ